MAESERTSVSGGWLSTVLKVGSIAAVLAALAAGAFFASSPEAPRDPFEEVSKLYPRKVEPGAEAATPEERISLALVGAASCRECHPGEAALYSRSGHARTLRRQPVEAVAKWLDGRTVKDPEDPAVTWAYALAGGKLEIERRESGKAKCYPVDFAVGSGASGVTFVSLIRPVDAGGGSTGIEHRLSYIARGPKLDVTPGQGEADSASKKNAVSPHGRDLDEHQLDKCLNCHATVTSTTGAGRVDPDTLVPNVSCERCHGPGRKHVDAAGRGGDEAALSMPHGSTSTSPVAQIELCGQCHRTLNSVPGSQVSEENPEIARFQPVGLALSRCFKEGTSGLSCTSCHDPHARVSRDVAAYESVCLSCHSPTHKKSCPVSARDGCIQCHMPKRTVSVDFEFTDHWIRRPKETPKADSP